MFYWRIRCTSWMWMYSDTAREGESFSKITQWKWIQDERVRQRDQIQWNTRHTQLWLRKRHRDKSTFIPCFFTRFPRESILHTFSGCLVSLDQFCLVSHSLSSESHQVCLLFSSYVCMTFRRRSWWRKRRVYCSLNRPTNLILIWILIPTVNSNFHPDLLLTSASFTWIAFQVENSNQSTRSVVVVLLEWA